MHAWKDLVELAVMIDTSYYLHAIQVGGTREGKIEEDEEESKRRRLCVLDGHVKLHDKAPIAIGRSRRGSLHSTW
jgi:hypothetical protein